MAQLVGLAACYEHRLDGPGVQRADVDVQPAADGLDIRHIILVVGHDRTAAGSKQDVCHIVNCHIVGDVVHQGHVFSYIVNMFLLLCFFRF